MFKFIGFVCVVGFFLLPFKDGDSVSDAAKNEIIQQIPPALDIVSAHHPLKVGLLRSMLNEHGEADSLVQSYVRSSMENAKNLDLFSSYLLYYGVFFDKDNIRAKMADSIEQKFGLKDEPPAQTESAAVPPAVEPAPAEPAPAEPASAPSSTEAAPVITAEPAQSAQ